MWWRVQRLSKCQNVQLTKGKTKSSPQSLPPSPSSLSSSSSPRLSSATTKVFKPQSDNMAKYPFIRKINEQQRQLQYFHRIMVIMVMVMMMMTILRRSRNNNAKCCRMTLIAGLGTPLLTTLSVWNFSTSSQYSKSWAAFWQHFSGLDILGT